MECVVTVKRAVEIAVASWVLGATLPLSIITVLAVRLESPGGSVYVQDRIGLAGRRFHMFKFRSMVADASRGVKRQRDPRLTRIGHSLRRFSVDEIPQLFNVIRGDMALVGPRPETPLMLEQYRPEDFQRFRVHPGITGLWQVSGRSQLSLEEKIELDLEYIAGRSAWRDLKIMARTPAAILGGRGAW